MPHGDYCARLDGNIKWMRSQGVPIRAVAPIVVEDYVAWCAEHDEDPEEARAAYAAHRMQRRRSDPVAARAQRAVLVRLRTQVQEVLRPGATRVRCTIRRFSLGIEESACRHVLGSDKGTLH